MCRLFIGSIVMFIDGNLYVNMALGAIVFALVSVALRELHSIISRERTMRAIFNRYAMGRADELNERVPRYTSYADVAKRYAGKIPIAQAKLESYLLTLESGLYLSLEDYPIWIYALLNLCMRNRADVRCDNAKISSSSILSAVKEYGNLTMIIYLKKESRVVTLGMRLVEDDGYNYVEILLLYTKSKGKSRAKESSDALDIA